MAGFHPYLRLFGSADDVFAYYAICYNLGDIGNVFSCYYCPALRKVCVGVYVIKREYGLGLEDVQMLGPL